MADARWILEKNGFKVQGVTPVASDAGLKGVVLSQTPAAGSKIGPDAVFSFQVAQ